MSEKNNSNKKISKTPSKIADDHFKQQFMQYLEVLKEKVAEMEIKVRESQNERNFYK